MGGDDRGGRSGGLSGSYLSPHQILSEVLDVASTLLVW